MAVVKRPIGRPRRYAKFEEFEASLPAKMGKRPAYCDNIGIYRGSSSETVWVKIQLPRGGSYKGASKAPGSYAEIKLGKRASWDWQQLIEERDRLQGLADRGEPLEADEVPTFATYATEWLERRKPTLRDFSNTRRRVITVLIPFFGKKALDAITVADINRWISLQSKTLKPATVKRQLTIFNAIVNDAVRSEVIERNPSKHCDRLKGADKERHRTVTGDEWKSILETLDSIEQRQDEQKEVKPHQIRGWLRHYVVWAYNSGMRRAEILSLKWSNIRPLGDGLTVVEIENTKSDKPRVITCTDEMLDILEGLQRLERVKGDDRLFPVSMTTLKRALTSLWKETGLQDVRLHDLRRTHATMLMQRNVDLRTIAGRLGHTGTDMLSKHYAMYLGDMEAAKAFSRPVERQVTA